MLLKGVNIMTNSKGTDSGRTRNYATVVYPESAPAGWLELLDDLHVSYAVSPLHDKDINATGETKKAHYHVMLMYDSVKTIDQARAACLSFGGVGCEKINAVRNYARYLCHLDNPDKWKYKESDVKCSGCDYLDLINLPSDKYGIIRDIKRYVQENGVLDFCDVFDYAEENHEDWFRVLCDSGAYIIKEYLKSVDYKWKRGGK